MKKIYKEILKQTVEGNITKDAATKLVKMMEEDDNHDIAIIGMSATYPNADDLESFWNLLVSGKDSFGEFPSTRKNNLSSYNEVKGIKPEEEQYIPGAYLNKIDEFDCKFFNIAPTDAEIMDPCQRMFLENTYHTIEDAGYAGKIKGSKTGIFIGYANDMRQGYSDFIDTLNPELMKYAVTGNLHSIISSRFSFFKDLKGPAVLIDTACSSSLVALHLACNSLIKGECAQALVGGVKINLYPIENNRKIGIESKDGKTRPFDKDSDGTGCGEGIASIMIKPLKNAMEDGDRIYAVIKGSAMNQDGEGAGITAPNVNSQIQVLQEAWKNANINPAHIDFIEAHGTATQLGDMIEIEALTEAFSSYSKQKQFCGLTAVKSNIGHLYEASGITGVIKAALCLYHKQVPGISNFHAPNQNINFEQSPLYVVDRTMPLGHKDRKSLCGVSSFGFSGTNCHMVLEEAPTVESYATNNKKEELFVLSAQTKEVLLDYAKKYAKYILSAETISLHEICYHTNCWKEQFSHRIALMVSSKEKLYQKLIMISRGNLSEENYSERKLIYNVKKEYLAHELPVSQYHKLCDAAKELMAESPYEARAKIKELYLQGAGIEWEQYYEEKLPKCSMPLYPFVREEHWVKVSDDVLEQKANTYYQGEILHPLVERLVAETPDMDVYETDLSAMKQFVLHDHIILGLNVMPGATYFEFASFLGERYLGTRNVHIKNLNFMVPFALQYEEHRIAKTIVTTKEDSLHFTVCSKSEKEEWITHVNCDIERVSKRDAEKVNLEEVRAIFDSEPIMVDQNELGKGFIEFKTRWLNFKKVYKKKNLAFGELELSEECWNDLEQYFLHPSLMDMGLNVASLTMGARYLPLAFETAKVYGPTPKKFYSVVHYNEDEIGAETMSFNVQLFDEDGNVFVEAENYHMKKVHEFKHLLGLDDNYSKIQWKEMMDVEDAVLEDTKVALIAMKHSSLYQQATTVLTAQNNEIIPVLFNDTDSEYSFTQEGFHKIIECCRIHQVKRIICAFAHDEIYVPEGIEEGKSVLKEIFYLTKALAESAGEEMQILMLGQSIFHENTSTFRLNAYNHSAYTMCKSVQKEKYGFTMKSVDISSLEDVAAAMNISFQVNADCMMIRDGKWYKEQAVKENIEVLPLRENSIKDNGVYLITGGTGGIGLEVAKEVAKKNQVQFVLVARSKMETGDWNQCFKKQTDDKKRRFYRTICEIEESGSHVDYLSCDVNQYEQLHNVVQKVKEKYGKINGFFHCAGLPGNGFLLHKSEEEFNRVVEPKINAVVNLHEVFKQDALDFGVFFSSIATVMALPGQSDYSAANAFMDSFARCHADKNYMAINWTAFNDVGMAVDHNSNMDTLFKTIGIKSAMYTLRQLLERQLSNVIVGEWNYNEEIYNFVNIEYSKEIYNYLMKEKNQLSNKKLGSKREVLLNGRNDGTYTETEKKIASVWGNVLGYSEINIYDSLYDLGGDSILAVKLNNEIDKMFHVHVSISDIFNHLTVNEFAKFLDDKMQQDYVDDDELIAVEEKETYIASPQQERLYITQIMDAESIAYNIPQALRIDGILDVEKLNQSFKALIERHDILRTSFELNEDVLVQRIHDKVNFDLEVASVEDDEHIIAQTIQAFIQAFDMSKAPMIRAKLLKLSEKSYILLTDIHHILVDASSIEILFHELIQIYRGEELPKITTRYRDYAEWVTKHNDSKQLEKQKAYWTNMFKDSIPTLDLHTDFVRPAKQKFDGKVLEFYIEKDATKKWKALLKKKGSTLYAGLLSIYNIVLAKYTGQEDIVVGTPIAGRLHEKTLDMVGLFINMLPMRNYPEKEKTFSAFLKEVMEHAMSSYENQEYSFERLMDQLDISRQLGRNPLFDTMLVLQNSSQEIELTNSGTPKIHLEFEQSELNAYPFEHTTSKYDLTLECLEREDKIVIYMEYSTALFKQETMERFAKHMLHVLDCVLEDPDIKIRDIELIGEEERFQILNQFNDTNYEYDKEQTIVDLFEAEVGRSGEKTAITFDGESLTYVELNQKANQLARKIRAYDIKAGEIIGVMFDRSMEMMISLMAVLKAGAAYMPIAPNYPADRIDYMLEDSNARLLLTHKGYDSAIQFKGNVIDTSDEQIYQGNDLDIEKIHTARDLAYIIYTSGSTGKPKGVMIEHWSIVNRLGWMQRQYAINEADKILQKTPYTFDVSVWELFWWSFTGAQVVFLGQGMEKDPILIAEAIQNYQITTMHFVPSMLSAFLECIEENQGQYDLHSLRQVFASGEAISKNQVERFKSLIADVYGTKLYNLYGPTEATVDVSYYDCLQACEYPSIPIGKPIDNTQLYIVDSENKLQPIGIAGELCIAGDGLARGYLNRVELTNEKFIKNPFTDEDSLMYRTGDLARWLSDGNIEYFSRMDHQVKIRGLRIELGEIESCLYHFGEGQGIEGIIKKAAIIDIADESGDKYLCAYYVSDEAIEEVALQQFLGETLPDYMIPAYFVHLSDLPVTANGKLDRKRLPRPEVKQKVSQCYVAPRNETERKLCEIWKKTLRVEEVGIDDNFFALGGHSLKAAGVSSKIYRSMNVHVELSVLFDKPTIRSLAEYIDKRKKEVYASIVPVEKAEYYETSSAQKRIYTLQQLEPDSLSYNIASAIEVDGIVDKDKLEQTMQKLVQRHEAFRTSFTIVDGLIVQKVQDSIAFAIEYYDAAVGEERDVVHKIIHGFDLSKAPLLQLGVVCISEEKHILVFNMHHIISDGISLDILAREFSMLYEGKELPALEIQYKDYSVWLNKQTEDGILNKHAQYWIEKFNTDSEVPILNLPLDFTRPTIQTYTGKDVNVWLDKDIADKIKTLAMETGTSAYMILLSAYNILLSKYSGQEDIIVGSPIAGRSNDELEGIIGMFVNTLALRNYPVGTKTFSAFLNEVRTDCLQAFENQDYPFEELVNQLTSIGVIKRDLSRNPLFDTMFAMQNMETAKIHVDGWNTTILEAEETTAKFDITFTVFEEDDTLRFQLQYCSDLFRKETMLQFAEHYINILKQVVTNSEVYIKDIDILSESEKKKFALWNQTEKAYAAEQSIHQIFEEMVEKYPDKIALTGKKENYTYRELNEKANQIARYLREHNVKENDIIGVIAENTPAMVVSILGILKSGAGYLPIDMAYPKERIEYMVQNSGASIILHGNVESDSNGITDCISNKDVKTVSIQTIFKENYATENLNETYDKERTFYVIYTSGSTGKPKGVAVREHSFLNLMSWYTSEFSLGEQDTIILAASISFDLAQKNLYGAILTGGTLCVTEERKFDFATILDLIEREHATLINCTPSAFQLLLANEALYYKLASLKYVILGGEPISIPNMMNWIQSDYYHAEIVNSYGPTECTDIAAIYRIPNDIIQTMNAVPLGYAIQNVKLYVLDQYGHQCITGREGELYIGGDGISKGYLYSEEENKKAFIANPYEPNETIYRTGDIVKWSDDGLLWYLGRADHQVKVKGYRIELGEIESRILECDGVKEAFVIVVKDELEPYICAYIVNNGMSESVQKECILNYIQDLLPSYMIPSAFVFLDKMPLNPNGKIDRKALPKPEITFELAAEYIAPKDAVEEELCAIWSELLNVEKVSTNSNFFELGGHSIKANLLGHEMKKRMHVSVPLKEIFRQPVLADLADYIRDAEKSNYVSLEPAEKMDYYPVTSAQKRLYLLHQMNRERLDYNLPGAMQMNGNLDMDKIKNVLDRLVERHDALRTYFTMRDEKPVQMILDHLVFSLEHYEGTKDELPNIMDKFVRPFDLSCAPLMRVGIVKQSETDAVMLFDMHHIITDGTSMQILIQEFIRLYNDEMLSELKVQYKDYAVYEQKLYGEEDRNIVDKKKEYWMNKCKDISVLNIPSDYERSEILDIVGNDYTVSFEPEEVARVKQFTEQNGITENMLFMGAFMFLLSKYSGQEDIVIGTPVEGRNHEDLHGMIGMFVNTLVMRNTIKMDMSVLEYFHGVKENLLMDLEYQDYQFEELVEQLNVPRVLNRNPLFDVMYSMVNAEDGWNMQYKTVTSKDGTAFTPVEVRKTMSKFDISLTAVDTGNDIQIQFTYATQLFTDTTIQNMAKHYMTLVQMMVAMPERKLSDISLLADEVKEELLADMLRIENRKDVEIKAKTPVTVLSMFAQQVSNQPSRIAVVSEDKDGSTTSVTYQELNEKANSLAHYLIANGARQGDVIGILLDRSVDTIVAILGVMKAGCAYMPMDVSYPIERIQYMMQDSGAKFVVSRTDILSEVKHLVDDKNFVDINCTASTHTSSCKIEIHADVEDIAYMIYTSGSTGRPKGIQISNLALVNLVKSLKERVYNKYESALHVALTAPFIFDASIKQIFPSLLLGNTLYIVPEEARFDGRLLLEFYAKYQIHISDGTPMHLGMMNEQNNMLMNDLVVKEFLIGGDLLTGHVVKRFFDKFENRKPVITNVYGPTECCDVTTLYSIDAEDFDTVGALPVGTPIENVEVFILDDYNHILPDGCMGELAISGVSLSSGYMNQKELTEQKFVTIEELPNIRVYKTGDFARKQSDGTLVIAGRMDNQVKVNGYRIELEEVETLLCNHPMIAEAVGVVKRETNQGDRFVAFYSAMKEENQEELDTGSLKNYLAKWVPKYMIPSRFIAIDKMPITVNGKVDKKALLEMELKESMILDAVTYIEPKGNIEITLAHMWEDILQIEQVGALDNFFEIGGHSLKAAIMIARIEKEFGTTLSFQDVFKTPTIRELAKCLENKDKSQFHAIEKVEESAYYELSSAQLRIYILAQMEEDSVTYNMPAAVILEGKLDTDRLEHALQGIVEHQEAFRTTFMLVEERPVQVIQKEVPFYLEYEDGTQKEVERLLQEFVQPFDLKKAPLLRVKLVKLEEEKHLLFIDMHHIISDGVSMQIFVEELTALYHGKQFEAKRVQYKDFAAWQNKGITTIQSQEQYWLEKYREPAPVLNLATDFERPSVTSFEGDKIAFHLDGAWKDRILKFTEERECTLYMLFLSCYSVLLSKYSGQKEFIIGSPVAGRRHTDLEDIIGVFVNMLPMRMALSNEMTVNELLQQVKKDALDAYENQDYQFEVLVDKLSDLGVINRDVSRNPLFDVVFTYQNAREKMEEMDALKITECDVKNPISKFDLTLYAREEKDGFAFEIEYATKLFLRESIERMGSHFLLILEQMIENPNGKMADFEITSKEEQKAILSNNVVQNMPFPVDRTLVMLFEEMVEKYPECIALVYEGTKLTYKELNERANQLASFLMKQGVKRRENVALLLERSAEMVISILAVLKAGGVYVPINPEYPQARIDYTLEDCGASVVIMQAEYRNKIVFTGKVIDVADTAIKEEDTKNPKTVALPEDPAYIIYTSGTTGKPKGVVIAHRNIVSLMYNKDMKFEFTEHDVWTMFHSYCFDFSVWEMYGALLYGGTLVVISKMVARDTKAYLELLKKEKVTVLNQIPVAFYNVVEEELRMPEKDLNLRYIIFGGEALKPIKLAGWKEKYPETKLINMYGITETTVHVTYREITDEDIQKNISIIGKPISTLRAYVMDENLKLLPVGVAGEMCVAGAGVSEGYLNREELTKQKFVSNPYVAGERIYRSGDLVKLLPDGELEYLGRIDHQVKIRGHRVELGEIESCLLQSNLVKDVVVLAKTDKQGIQNLCAFYVSEQDLSENEIKETMAKTLPDYMIPTYFVPLDKIPMTAIGKVDRAKLVIPEHMYYVEEYVKPNTELQIQLAHIWEEILEIEQVGIHENFFQIGGHSLRATMLASKIRKEFEVEVSLLEVFQNKTIIDLETLILQKKKECYIPIPKAEKSDCYPLSSAQRRLYILNQFDSETTSYNMPAAFELTGESITSSLLKKMEEAFFILMERHELLRTSIELINGEPVQKIHAKVPFTIPYKEYVEVTLEEIMDEFIQPFHLEDAPLIRLQAVKCADKQYLLLDMHHIISDGISMTILMDEFTQLYQEMSSLETSDTADILHLLPEQSIQYKDYAVWQYHKLNGQEALEMQKEYWLKQFADEIPQLNLPTDYERGAIQNFDGGSINFVLEKEIKDKLEAFALEQDCTVYMVMLAVYNTLLYKYTGQEDIIVGSPVAGRRHPDLERVLGAFINVLPMRNYPKGEVTFQAFLQDVKAQVLDAFENQDFQFEELVEELGLQRDLSRNPLFDTMLVLQNENRVEKNIALNGMQIKPVEFEVKQAKYDITLNIHEHKDTIQMQFAYCTKLFKESTMHKFAERYQKLLVDLMEAPDCKLAEFEVVSKEEKEKILYEFNATKHEYENQLTLIELFEQQVERTPNEVALIMGEETLSYQQLDEKSNQLARLLRTHGLEEGKVAVLSLERSFTMVIGILAVLKAGGAYLPADPLYPMERLELLIQESNAAMVLTVEEDTLRTALHEKDVMVVGVAEERYASFDKNRIERTSNVESLAYLIFTSGTTGIPKGVMIENRSIVNTILWRKEEYQFTTNDRILQLFSYCFDGFVTSLFTPLVSGAGVVLLEEYDAKDPVKIVKAIQRYEVSHFICVPTLYRAICAKLEPESAASLRIVTLAGEKVVEQDRTLAMNVNPNMELVNEYGPTESSVAATIMRNVQASEQITIGKPIWNTNILILDSYGNIQPIGVEGEICIVSNGLARGYINNVQENEKRFVSNPFDTMVEQNRMYRTGDLAKWDMDGNIIYIGRMDSQVKWNGFRIELSEIESVLMDMEAIAQVVVSIVQDNNHESHLCAYYTMENQWNETEISRAEFRSYLEKKLPQYMIPSYYVPLEAIPVTDRGKVDKKALPQVEEFSVMDEDFTAPENALEEMIAHIWCRVLGKERVSVTTNFFELGGQSLSAASMLAELNKELSLDLSLKEVFQASTVRELALRIGSMEKTPYHAIEKAEVMDVYPLSSAQKRVFIAQQMNKESTSYNISGALELTGEVDIEKIRVVFERIIERHEILRTSFIEELGEIVQKVNEPFHFELEELPCKGSVEEAYHAFIKPFDLASRSLFRAGIIRMHDTRCILVLDMHHIISDGVSMRVLLKEFKELYQQLPLPELKIQYKDYATWQNQVIKSKEMELHEKYWIDKLSDFNFTELPSSEYVIPKTKGLENKDAAFKEILIESALVSKIDSYCVTRKATRFAMLLAISNLALYTETQQSDLCVGIPSAGRNHAETEKMIGMFLNVLMIRTKMNVEKGFQELVDNVSNTILEADMHQDYPFEVLDMKVKEQNHLKGDSLFSILVNYVPKVMEEELELDGMVLKTYPIDEYELKYDITLYMSEKNDGIRLRMVYNATKYEEEMIERYLTTMIQLLEMVLEGKEESIKDIYSKVLLKGEDNEMLLDFEDEFVDFIF